MKKRSRTVMEKETAALIIEDETDAEIAALIEANKPLKKRRRRRRKRQLKRSNVVMVCCQRLKIVTVHQWAIQNPCSINGNNGTTNNSITYPNRTDVPIEITINIYEVIGRYISCESVCRKFEWFNDYKQSERLAKSVTRIMKKIS